MDTLEKREIQYERAVALWGDTAQYEMAQEEATELALAIRKATRNPSEKTYSNLVSEVADMKIMIEQLELMNRDYGFEEAVQKEMAFKVNRLKERIDKKSFNLPVSYEEVKTKNTNNN